MIRGRTFVRTSWGSSELELLPVFLLPRRATACSVQKSAVIKAKEVIFIVNWLVISFSRSDRRDFHNGLIFDCVFFFFLVVGFGEGGSWYPKLK